MMQTGEIDLHPIWTALLEIFAEYDSICTKEGLTYYAAYGTALGAVRHGGFIPWDDDFDVIMPREDFDRFVERCESLLPPHLKLVTWRNTHGYPNVFAKIIESRREKVVAIERESGSRLNQGIYIDVFPLDGYPSSWLGFKWWHLKYLFIRCVEWDIQKKKSTRIIHIVERMLGFFCHMLVPWVRSQEDIMPYLERLSRSVKYSGSYRSGYVVDHTFFIPKCHDTAIFGKPQRVRFMNYNVNLPSDANAYLRVEYGNYMQLPPDEKRIPHHGASAKVPWRLG